VPVITLAQGSDPAVLMNDLCNWAGQGVNRTWRLAVTFQALVTARIHYDWIVPSPPDGSSQDMDIYKDYSETIPLQLTSPGAVRIVVRFRVAPVGDASRAVESAPFLIERTCQP
jgi:hypothetical protein